MLRASPTRRWAAGLFVLALAVIPALAAPPRVQSMTPENGATGVDPATSEIRVVFDQPMSHRGHSVVGGGETFPPFAGKTRWANARTFVIPVKLEPDREYRFGINSRRFQNFRGATGEPAEPYPVRFWTAPGADAVPLTRDQNEAAYEELVRTVTTLYSHRDRLGIDWAARLERFREDLVASATPTEFARHTARLLAAAKDKHIHVRSGEADLSVYLRPVPPNANVRTLAKLVPGWAEPNGRVRTGRFDDGVGFISINSWSSNHAGDLDAVFEAIESMQDAPGLIVDVRLNGGGDELLARSVAGCFITEPRLYATHVSVTEDGGFTEPRERWFGPTPGRPHFSGPVAVLMGPVCLSSNEAFLLMMRQVPSARLFGTPSQGSSGNPRRHDLGNGVSVSLPSWIAMTPDGTPFEGVGLEPDERVDATPEDFETTDPVLDAALAWLRGGG